MDARGETASLSELTRAFYDRTHDSFSATRQQPWQGWDELWSCVGEPLDERASKADGLRVADVACGNLRFGRFLLQKTKAPLAVYAFDGCEPLLTEGLRALSGEVGERAAVHGAVCDIAEALAEGTDFMADAGACDLTVAFGFLHHLPLNEQRKRLLRLMAAHTAEGGFLAASFWRFANDERLREKAREATQRAQEAGAVERLSEGDYVLGWQDDAQAFRFCHHFTDEEIDGLSAGIADVAEEVGRFSADGKSGALNRYVVWRRHG